MGIYIVLEKHVLRTKYPLRHVTIVFMEYM
jgi:hypothetical protein